MSRVPFAILTNDLRLICAHIANRATSGQMHDWILSIERQKGTGTHQVRVIIQKNIVEFTCAEEKVHILQIVISQIKDDWLIESCEDGGFDEGDGVLTQVDFPQCLASGRYAQMIQRSDRIANQRQLLNALQITHELRWELPHTLIIRPEHF